MKIIKKDYSSVANVSPDCNWKHINFLGLSRH